MTEAVSTKNDYGDIRYDASAPAQNKAKAKLRKQNKGEWKCELTMLGNLAMVEGVTFSVEGWGVYDGKYIAETVTHTLDGSGGFETQVTGHRVLKGY